MSLFDSIKNAIFGHPAAAAPAPTTAGAANAPSMPSHTATPPVPSTPPAVPSGTPKPAPVDIETVLTSMAKNNPQKLNWQSSIVDLMKLVGLDPSLQNRKQLASELGYAGDPNDSAQMNIWLHKQVMQKLVENGGIAPASLRV